MGSAVLLLLAATVQPSWQWSVGTGGVVRSSSRYSSGVGGGSCQRRCGAASMFEAYDLAPVVQCLQSADMDTVQVCLDNISPWLQVTEEGAVIFSDKAIAGFIGGTVGVVGSVIATFVKRDEVKDRLKCSYCSGTGQIICGNCFGSGTVTVNGNTETCPNCEGTGTVVCINCQGSGISVPEDIMLKLGDSEAGFTEEDYIGLFDEVKFPTLDSTSGRKTGEEAEKATAEKAGTTASQEQVKDFDPTGGLG